MKTYEPDDPSALRELTLQRVFGLQRAVIETALGQARADLEKPADAETTASLRGRIEGLKLALEAPSIATRQAREALKRNQVEET